MLMFTILFGVSGAFFVKQRLQYNVLLQPILGSMAFQKELEISQGSQKATDQDFPDKNNTFLGWLKCS